MKRISILVSTVVLCLPLILAGCDRGKEERARLQNELTEIKIASQKTSSEKATLETELAEVTKARDDLQAQVARLTGEESKLRGQIAKLTGSSQRLDGEVTKLTGSLEKLTEQLKEITDSRDQLQKDLAELKKFRDALQVQVKELTKQRDEAVAGEKQAREELAALIAAAAAAAQAASQAASEPNDELVAITETPVVEGPALPTVHSFASTRTKVDKGQSATLTWHVSDASEIRIEPGVGSVSALGSTNVKPTKTTTYKLTAINDSGQTVETCKVEVR
jgi:DNA repair exonuclease SbcCD ATPase subunit